MGAYGDEGPRFGEEPLRKCYREPGEPNDGRPTVWRRPFWSSEEEASAYLSAVRNHPREVDVERDEIESSMAYIARMAGIVQRGPLVQPAKRMPTRREERARPPIVEGGLSFEDRLDVIYERQPGEEG